MAGVSMNLTSRIQELWRLPSAKEMAAKELEEAKRRFLEAQSAMEYTRRMADYHADRIKRLTNYLESSE
jgi:N-glycosylase/DNA lyase